MKKLLTILLCICTMTAFSQTEKGIYIESTFGFGMTNIQNSNHKNSIATSTYQGMSGTTVGLNGTYMISDKCGIIIGISTTTYTNYSTSVQNDLAVGAIQVDIDGDSYIPVVHTDYDELTSMRFLNIPIGIRIQLGNHDKIRFFFGSGIQFSPFLYGNYVSSGYADVCGAYLDGFWAGETHCTESEYGFGRVDLTTAETTAKNEVNMNFSLWSDIGTIISLHERLSLNIGVRYETGLSNVNNDSSQYQDVDGTYSVRYPTKTNSFMGRVGLTFKL